MMTQTRIQSKKTLYRIHPVYRIALILTLSMALYGCQVAPASNETSAINEAPMAEGDQKDVTDSEMEIETTSTPTLIQLQDPLDEPEFYCVDVPGFGTSLNLEGALTGHTCKPGADDEMFTIHHPAQGQIYMPAYDLCVEADSFENLAELHLRSCSDSIKQRFAFMTDGTIQLQNPDAAPLCLALATGEGEPTGGPSHLRRNLMLVACTDLDPALSQWVLPGPNPVAQASASAMAMMRQEDHGPLPIFDTHMHYSKDAWSAFSPSQIIALLENANIPRALVSSSPDDGTRMLYAEDPERIVPFMRLYHDEVTSGNWHQQDVLPYLSERLEMPIYLGIGEFHLHDDVIANLPVVHEIARIAVERDIYLHIHSDAQAVRAVFAHTPDVKILWAHAGMTEPPDVVSRMMDEFTNLWTDISYREYAIAPAGQLDPAWEALFLKHPDRITVGSDTWITPRWRGYEQIIEQDRQWLEQLPRDIAKQIAYGNAVRLFGAGPHKALEE